MPGSVYGLDNSIQIIDGQYLIYFLGITLLYFHITTSEVEVY